MTRPKSLAPISAINVVPYIDVMLVLLVIFMITAPLLTQGVIVDLPDVPADALDTPLADTLVLTVDSEGRFYLSFGGDPDEPLEEQDVLERASAVVRRDAATPIFVRGDEGAAHGRVMHGFALLRRAGAQRAVLAVEWPEPDAPP
jgi:biopolymer transport protein TolR